MRNLSDNKGFTLVEVMVALLITGILMVIVFRFVFDQMRGYQRETMVADTQQNVRVVMDEITRDIRMAGAGIPAVPIYTGNTGLTDNSIYPLYIVQGRTLSATNDANQIFSIASTAAGTNESIIIIYKDPSMSAADTVLTQDMLNSTDPITVDSTKSAAFTKNTPFIVTDAAGTKADLYIITSAPTSGDLPHATTNTVYNSISGANIGHGRNFSATASGGATYLGYKAGDKVFAVRVVRYDWSSDLANANYPITRLVNDDTIRATNDAIGEFFGSTTDPNTAIAMDIQWAPFYGTGSSVTFSQGMPAQPYNIGAVKVTLTARTAVKGANFSNTTMLRTRTLTTDVQLRNYGR